MNIPHLVVRFIEQPRENVDTRKAGWMNDPNNVKTMEEVSVVDRINNRNRTCPVIINLITAKVMSNRTNRSDEEVVSHYVERYRDTIKEALKVWARENIMAAHSVIETIDSTIDVGTPDE